MKKYWRKNGRRRGEKPVGALVSSISKGSDRENELCALRIISLLLIEIPYSKKNKGTKEETMRERNKEIKVRFQK